ncbi:MAG: polyphenol oxidase family protein [Desulfovibrionaceae bacterium]
MAVTIIPFVFPGVPRVRCAFQTREGGASAGPFAAGNISMDVGDAASAVLANRKALLAACGVRQWRELRQVHGDAMDCDPAPTDPALPGEVAGDGHATARPGVALAIKTADCQPLLLAHASGRYVAALHVGWRGNRIGFIGSAVAALCARYGVSPADLHAVRGPSLGPANSEFVHFDQEWGAGFSNYFDAFSQTMDLWRLTRDQLAAAGLLPANIHSLDRCTLADAAFFSYRRDRACGRQASLIWIEP